jgi:hypothetical protein
VAATTVASASPALVPTAGDCAAVVGVTDDDAPPRVGAMGKPVHVNSRAYTGGVGDAGGWLHDVAVPGARRRGLNVACCPTHL